MKSTISRWSLILALVAVVALVSAPLAARPAAAATEWYDVVNHFIVCSMVDQGTVWFSDDDLSIMHIRDRVLQAVVISTDDYHAGTGWVWPNANIDTATGLATYHGYMEIHPDAYDGYWAGHWVMQITPSGAGGIARLQGYDELDGWSTKSDLYPLFGEDLAAFAYLCGGSPPISGTYVEARVMNPGGK
jgi:hypothetical protein